MEEPLWVDSSGSGTGARRSPLWVAISASASDLSALDPDARFVAWSGGAAPSAAKIGWQLCTISFG
ncbi:MAG: hypothetical protein WBW67_08435, partial [Pseudolabrys sp.]